MIKLYRGIRDSDGQCWVTVDGVPLPLRLDLANHSPTGFEWGYGGSGPAQLALAICAHALGDDQRALRVYQQFKERCVVNMAHGGWEMSNVFLKCIVESIERDNAELENQP